MADAPGMRAGAPPPQRILVAGDWHGDQAWALNVIKRVPQLLAAERTRLVLQLGDFGIWAGPDGRRYLAAVGWALEQVGAQLWFLDGNHEDFTLLDAAAGAVGGGVRVQVAPGIFHLPRGHRWAWHGRTWLACGGGVSLDRATRTEGRDWWPQEEITPAQAAAITGGGRAEVLACHDCPSGVRHTFGRPPREWAPADLARNDAHRQRLQQIADAVQPAHVLHGHLHRAYQRDCDFGYGPVQVTGLAADGKLANFAMLDVATMTWPRRRRRIIARPARMWPGRRG
jgi:hypothetical protein